MYRSTLSCHSTRYVKLQGQGITKQTALQPQPQKSLLVYLFMDVAVVVRGENWPGLPLADYKSNFFLLVSDKANNEAGPAW